MRWFWTRKAMARQAIFSQDRFPAPPSAIQAIQQQRLKKAPWWWERPNHPFDRLSKSFPHQRMPLCQGPKQTPWLEHLSTRTPALILRYLCLSICMFQPVIVQGGAWFYISLHGSSRHAVEWQYCVFEPATCQPLSQTLRMHTWGFVFP